MANKRITELEEVTQLVGDEYIPVDGGNGTHKISVDDFVIKPIEGKQNVEDDTLETTDKTIPGAINEVLSGLAGKQNTLSVVNETMLAGSNGLTIYHSKYGGVHTLTLYGTIDKDLTVNVGYPMGALSPQQINSLKFPNWMVATNYDTNGVEIRAYVNGSTFYFQPTANLTQGTIIRAIYTYVG